MALNELQSDGKSLRAHLESVERQTGHTPDQLISSSCPVELEYLWAWFCDLSATRGSNGFGANPISYLEISMWSQLKRIGVEPWEVDAIKSMDRIYLAHSAKKQDANK